jgi:hypothetical protein
VSEPLLSDVTATATATVTVTVTVTVCMCSYIGITWLVCFCVDKVIESCSQSGSGNNSACSAIQQNGLHSN